MQILVLVDEFSVVQDQSPPPGPRKHLSELLLPSDLLVLGEGRSVREVTDRLPRRGSAVLRDGARPGWEALGKAPRRIRDQKLDRKAGHSLEEEKTGATIMGGKAGEEEW